MALNSSDISPKHDMDQAYDFLAKAGAGFTEEQTSGVDLRRLRRKVDWRIVPLMFACYTLSFLDKVALNYGAVMGLVVDLKLQGNQFANASTFFFVAYLIFELPTGLILNKVPAGKWLGINVTLWGIATACTAAATGYRSLLACRIFLGIFEAAIAPCLMLLSSQWYTKSEQAPRFSFWYCGLGAGQMIGSLVSFGFQHAPKTGFAGWQGMFVTLGIVTVVVGLITTFFMPDSPLTASFLDDGEKTALLQHVSANRTGVVNRKFNGRQALEIFVDPQMWLISILTISLSVTSGVVTTFSATLLATMGFKPKFAALLNIGSGPVSITAAIVSGLAIRRASNRWAWIVACATPGIIGGALLSFMNTKGGVLAGIYLVNTVTATLPIIYQWTAANVAGQTKRSFSMSLISGAFSIGNIIGPQTFQDRDAPQYLPAKIAVLATLAGGAFVSCLLFVYYRLVNAQRDRKSSSSGSDTDAGSNMEEKWANLTDRQNFAFRYVY